MDVNWISERMRVGLPFDLANKSFTFDDDDPEESPDDEELMSTSSFSKSCMEKFAESSLARVGIVLDDAF